MRNNKKGIGRIANAHTQSGRITNPTERKFSYIQVGENALKGQQKYNDENNRHIQTATPHGSDAADITDSAGTRWADPP